MRDTKTAFDVLQFTQVNLWKYILWFDKWYLFLILWKQQQIDLFKITSAVANWGNTQWKQRPREEQAEPDGTDELCTVAALLGLDEQDLIKGIPKPRIKVQ
jgi:hypothetical protein